MSDLSKPQKPSSTGTNNENAEQDSTNNGVSAEQQILESQPSESPQAEQTELSPNSSTVNGDTASKEIAENANILPSWDDVCVADSPPVHPDLAAYFAAAENNQNTTEPLESEIKLEPNSELTSKVTPPKELETELSEETTQDSTPSPVGESEPVPTDSQELTSTDSKETTPEGSNEPASAESNSDESGLVKSAEEENESRTSDSEAGDGTEDLSPEARPLTIRDHFIELRKRFTLIFLFAIGGFIVCYPFAMRIFEILVIPLKAAMPDGKSSFVFTAPGEGFFTSLKVAFVAGIFVASPFIFYQIWAFIAPGLYDTERKYLLPVAFFSAFFFICGGLFCYLVVFPFAFEFFMSYASEDIMAMLSLNQTLSFTLQLLIAFGLIFELPLFVFFLARMGLVTAEWMRSVRRYAILVNVVIAAILTPPDVISQGLMAAPMLLLYELSILVAAVFGRKKKSETAEDAENAETSDPDALVTQTETK